MKDKVKDVYDIFSGRALGILPGNLAFSFFLAIIPILTILFFVLTNLNLPLDIIQNFLNNTFPEGVNSLLEPIFTSQITLDSIITIVFGLLVTANGCNAIILASNTIYNIDDASLLKRYIKSFVLTILLILLFSFIVIVPLFGRSIISILARAVDSYIEYALQKYGSREMVEEYLSNYLYGNDSAITRDMGYRKYFLNSMDRDTFATIIGENIGTYIATVEMNLNNQKRKVSSR